MLCPAKINLGLRVLYKRPDNYHEIESIFLKLNWGDDIHFVENNLGIARLFSVNELRGVKRSLFEEVSERGDFSKNILFKTFEKSKELKKDLPGVDIHLTKRIPPGGGLGGGSTNAASLLNFIFHNEQEKTATFHKMVTSIGADVPFFLSNGNFHVSGIGEILKPIKVASGAGILAIPPFSINTKESYLSLKKPLQSDWGQKSWSLLDEDFSNALRLGEWSKLREKFENDFEKYAFSEFPSLESLKLNLYNLGCSFVSMTGTGSCVYGFVQEKEQASILEKMTQKYPEHYFIQFSF